MPRPHRSRPLLALAVATVALALPATAAGPDVGGAWAVDLAPADGVAPAGVLPVTERASCSGSAPPVYLCTTGLYTSMPGTINLSLAAQNYRGTLENRLDWFYGALVFRCDIQGASASCTVTGGFPPIGATLLHNCRSYALGSSVPGGMGSWSCGFRQS